MVARARVRPAINQAFDDDDPSSRPERAVTIPEDAGFRGRPVQDLPQVRDIELVSEPHRLARPADEADAPAQVRPCDVSPRATERLRIRVDGEERRSSELGRHPQIPFAAPRADVEDPGAPDEVRAQGGHVREENLQEGRVVPARRLRGGLHEVTRDALWQRTAPKQSVEPVVVQAPEREVRELSRKVALVGVVRQETPPTWWEAEPRTVAFKEAEPVSGFAPGRDRGGVVPPTEGERDGRHPSRGLREILEEPVPPAQVRGPDAEESQRRLRQFVRPAAAARLRSHEGRFGPSDMNLVSRTPVPSSPGRTRPRPHRQ